MSKAKDICSLLAVAVSKWLSENCFYLADHTKGKTRGHATLPNFGTLGASLSKAYQASSRRLEGSPGNLRI